ncbi:hypothetical protein ENSA5_40780 [Enhygromyxa salina]|uniref:Capsule biosynthesis CapC n=1 Tax=Enhygromyxa salina TaxID=215803 RepID=A0A2S9XNL0_9BACT|nr:poly-gamma-glutamate biosynthesis protein PgsC/CapC [Enhygromyxa salina]PRP94459.1 hypothetical protein ENSA5_40780 [Enhygromyxa salina]
MNETFVLELLPARGLDQSMLLPVLVGLIVVLLCTETFGWVFAGAVVPGYLASVLVIQPVTGVIVISESLVTLAISAGLAKGLSKTDAWTRFFGRERFFLILVVSLVVRMHDHAWFAPWAIGALDGALGTRLETQQEFYSIGLVLVPLTANMLWKPAIHRGLLQLGVQVGITYLVVRYVLLPHTNLSLSSVALTYENVATDFVGNAKAHIILLTAALLAAQFNLTYGWDFNGILVPALLAMLWLTPLKLLATLGEAMIVLFLTRSFLGLPLIRHLDFEGPRKIVLVFSLAFCWKLALGFSLAPIFPELKISDTYGFGYLLSSLLAVKMLGVKSVRSVMLPSLMASAGGFVLGSLAGFLLELVAPQRLPPKDLTQPESARLTSNPLGVMTLARMDFEARSDEPEPPTQAEIGRLREFWSAAARLQLGEGTISRIAARVRGGTGFLQLDSLRRSGAGLGLQVVELGTYPAGLETESEGAPLRTWLGVVAEDAGGRRGFASGLLIPEAKGPVLVVPMPWSEAPVAEAAAIACRRVDCRAVLVAGHERSGPGTAVSARPLEIAMQAFDADVVVFRAEADEDQAGFAGNVARSIAKSIEPLGQAQPESAVAGARIHQLRGYFDLVDLWPDYELDWEPRETVVRMPRGTGDFVLLRTTLARYEAFVAAGAHELRAGVDGDRGPDEELDGSVDADPSSRLGTSHLLTILTEIHEDREPAGTAGARYRSPSDTELLVLEKLIVEPLMDWADSSPPGQPPPPGIAVRAAELDYELVELGDCRAGEGACLVVLRERSLPSTSGWGTLVVRRQRGSRPHVVEVPRPHRESQTWRVGAELWQILEGRALLIAGADGLPRDPERARDSESEDDLGEVGTLAPSPDPVRPGNLETPFHAFHQTIDRTSEVPFEFVQLRGIASYRPITHDVIVGIGLPAAGTLVDAACWGQMSPELRPLVASWDSCQVADGSEDLYLLSGAGTPQLEYSRELGNGRGRVLWLSAGLRERYAAPRTSSVGRIGVVRGLEQAGLTVVTRGEVGAMLAPLWPPSAAPSLTGGERVVVGKRGLEVAVGWAVGFAETGNLHLLRALRELRDVAVDLRVTAAVGRDFGQPFLIIEYMSGVIGQRAIVSLDHTLDGRVELSYAELGQTPTERLRTEALARPQVMVLVDIPIEGLGQTVGPAPAVVRPGAKRGAEEGAP